MGTCKECGADTESNYPLCRKHYYFNIKSFRFWFAFTITLVWEFLINFPIISEDGLILMLLKSLFEETESFFFLIGIIGAEVLIFVSSLMYMNYLVYRYFYSKKAIIKLG